MPVSRNAERENGEAVEQYRENRNNLEYLEGELANLFSEFFIIFSLVIR